MPNSLAEPITKNDLDRLTCEESFEAFVQRFWGTVIPEDMCWNWHMTEICNEMQIVAERVFKGLPKEYDLVINVPPGSSKSTICSIMFPAWVWTRMKTARCICGSYSYPLQLELSRKCRDVIQSEKYQELWPHLSMREDQNTKGHFVNEFGGERYSTSTGSTVTGFHGHFLIVDDPLNPESAVSEADLKTANNWMNRTLPTRKVDKRVTPTILIMQRLHEDDPSAQALKRKTPVRHINLPAEIDKQNEKDVRPRILKKRYVDGLLDPVRMDRKSLEEARDKLLEYGFSGQFQQRPVPLSGGMFKMDRVPIEHPHTSFIQKCRFWDKAGTEDGGAWTVGFLLGEDVNHRFWILDVIRVQKDSGQREILIKDTADMDGLDIVVGIEQEPGSGGKESAENTVKNLRGYITEVVRPTGDKRVRALPFSSQVNNRNVSMVPADWNKELINEFALFPKSKYKDQVDSGAGAFTVLTFPNKRIGVL